MPPYRGLVATIAGMTWARGAIFFGSDLGKQFMRERGINSTLSSTLPPFIISTLVQCINMPIVRATITIQNPKSELNSVSEAMVHIYKTRGLSGLWHGVSAGILKTVPKYITAIYVKDYMENTLKPADKNNKSEQLTRAAIKSVTAGVAGAALTNPLDVIRNEMFKTDLGIVPTVKNLMNKEGFSFMSRGMTSNLTAVAIPIAVTIFMTDVLMGLKDKVTA